MMVSDYIINETIGKHNSILKIFSKKKTKTLKEIRRYISAEIQKAVRDVTLRKEGAAVIFA